MAGYQEEPDLFGDNDDVFDFDAPIDGDLKFDAPTDELPDELPQNVFENAELGGMLGEGEVGLDEIMRGLEDRELEPGEKADNAVDYGDVSDDDLPDEEPVGGPVQSSYQPLSGIEDAAMTDGTPDGPLNDFDDDLFGGSSPPGGDADLGGLDSFGTVALPANIDAADAIDTPVADNDDGDKASLASEHQDGADHQEAPLTSNQPDDTEDAKMLLLQMMLFGGKVPETEEENLDEWVRTEFPTFKQQEIPYFNRLFPPRHSRWLEGKTPLKPPKPLRPTKVTLEIESDQRLLFNSAGVANLQEPRSDIVHIVQPTASNEDSELYDESDGDEPLPGGITMQDLEFLCTDFDTLSHPADSDTEGARDVPVRIADPDAMFDEDDFEALEPARKKRKLGLSDHDIVTMPHFPLPDSFDNFERMTAKIASKPLLDLNDTNLLLEEVDPEAMNTKSKPGVKTKGPQTVVHKLFDRFNTSNDTEYDLLKQNHQHKVRGQLGHTTIDHSMPAIRLQYPYYPVQLSLQELRNWHRKKIHFRAPITFSKAPRQKRKVLKGKEPKEIFSRSKDLSLGDNSTAALFEYSEEHPTMLSSTGMGNKIVNYYRRKSADDATRPKHDIGELTVLLPEDKSPFNTFGHIDGGEEMTALVNSMYKAPVFEQNPGHEDFLVVRESTGLEGQRYYIRSIDNAFVVGQELPTMTVPGIHSRNVTSASKYRLRAIAYRIIRHRKSHRLRVEDVTRHFPDTTDMQNRQKMKEFMVFNKQEKEWEMAKGNTVPGEDTVQSLLKPEDIALLEAKDVGAQYLRDAGYGEDDYDEDKDNKDNAAGTASTDQLLAPWRATKNFVYADQGKAMLQLHGEGDPSGRGEAYSFLKTSMKGGFRAQGAPVADTVQAKKELGGHSYNVAKQQRDYEEAIRKIWIKQKDALSSKVPPSDPTLEGDIDTQEDNLARQSTRATPAPTPGGGRRANDDNASSFSRASQGGKKWLKITRTVVVNGKETQQVEVVSDPAIIKAYTRRKEQLANSNLDITRLSGPSGNAEMDAKNEERIRAEIARLEANQARNKKRASKKAATTAGSPDGDAASPDGDGTPSGKQTQPTMRKCANCGQVGHIKTNKKLCPLLNGTMKQDDVGKNKAFMGMAPPPMV